MKLSYADPGNITGALVINWGISAFILPALSDHVGRETATLATVLGAAAALIVLAQPLRTLGSCFFGLERRRFLCLAGSA